MVKQKQKSKVTALRFAQMIAVLLIASCAPLETTSTATRILPPTVGGNIIPITASPTAAPAQTSTPPAQISIPKSDIAQLADDLFGARQIESISIPALNVEGVVVPVGWRVNYSDDLQSGAFEWDSPDANVGWVITSALPDEIGNIVLYGHNNTYGKIFSDLSELSKGSKIYLQAKSRQRAYEVRYILILPIFGASAEQIQGYQKYLKPTADARLTIISCWPPVSNTHRVVVIAMPSGQ